MMPPPRAWFDPWPSGAVRPGAPSAAIWLARLAAQLRDHLDDSDETVTAFAARAGLSADTVRDVLDGHRWPTIHTVHAITATVRGPRSRGSHDR